MLYLTYNSQIFRRINMDIYSLLDKNDQVELKIFNELMKKNMKHQATEIRKRLNLSRGRFSERIESLIARLKATFPDVSLNKTENDLIILLLPLSFNVSDLYYCYLKEAVNYKILTHLYQDGKLDIFLIIEDLYLSESTYYRRIREINNVLAEFDLKIINGTLKGDELQIRYFFFNLFWYFMPLTYIVEENDDLTIKNLIAIIENQSKMTFSFFDYQKLFLWLKITIKRINHAEKQPSRVVDYYLIVVREKESYQQTKNIFFRFLSRLALPFQNEEVLFVYLFLISQFITPLKAPFFNDVFLDISPKIEPTITKLESYLYAIFDRNSLTEESQVKIRYSFINIIYTELFFTGFSVYFDNEKLQDIGQELVSLPFDVYVDKLYYILQTIYQDIQKRPRTIMKQSKAVKNEALIFRLLCVLSYVDKVGTPRFLIGFDYYGDDLLKELSYEVTMDLVKQAPLVVCEPYMEDGNYDLVLSNSDVNKEKYGTSTYVFSEVLTPQEMRYLRRIIKDLHLEKIEKQGVKV